MCAEVGKFGGKRRQKLIVRTSVLCATRQNVKDGQTLKRFEPSPPRQSETHDLVAKDGNKIAACLGGPNGTCYKGRLAHSGLQLVLHTESVLRSTATHATQKPNFSSLPPSRPPPLAPPNNTGTLT